MAGLRYFCGAVAFGFAAMWIMASLAAALVCLLSAIVGYGAVVVAQRMRGTRAVHVGPTAEAEGLPLWADALNSDLGHIYEPAAATSALTREAEYGWPLNDDTVIASGGTLN